MTQDQMIECRRRAGNGSDSVQIPESVFVLLRQAILDILNTRNAGLKDLPKLVRAELGPDKAFKIKALSRQVGYVRQELEVRGEIRRLPRVSPPMLMLSPEFQGSINQSRKPSSGGNEASSGIPARIFRLFGQKR